MRGEFRAVRGAVGGLKATTPCSSSLPPLIPPSLFPPSQSSSLPCPTLSHSPQPEVTNTAKRQREKSESSLREGGRGEEEKKVKPLKAKKVNHKHNSDSIGRLGQKTFRGCGRKACATQDAHAKVLNLFGSSELLPGRKKTPVYISLKF